MNLTFLTITTIYHQTMLRITRDLNRRHRPPVQESCDAAAFLVSWLWRANGVTTEEDGVNDPQTIINEEFTSDKREFVEKWCQETDLGRE